MKPYGLMVCLFFLILSSSLHCVETKINFSATSGGGYYDYQMHTSAAGIVGDIYWESNLRSYQNGNYYYMQYLIDSVFDGSHNHYWLVQGGLPSYLKIVFPQSVYLTKIRTHHIAYTEWPGGDNRWLESDLYVSSNGTNFSQAGTILVDSTPSVSDYVDIAINSWVTEIKYLPFINKASSYSAMGEVEIFMDSNFQIPEISSAILVGFFLAIFMLSRTHFVILSKGN